MLKKMKKPIALLTLAVFGLLGSTLASATALSMNEVAIPEDADLRDCQALGTQALETLGLDGISTGFSVIAFTPSEDLITIYCLPEHDLAIIAVAGDSRDTTRPMLGEIQAVAQNWVK